jgi:hypothetical protein|tara:strand:+ start:454 stop:618 length:165 start_codon:yes stop_codon:yes gene_type:complete
MEDQGEELFAFELASVQSEDIHLDEFDRKSLNEQPSSKSKIMLMTPTTNQESEA